MKFFGTALSKFKIDGLNIVEPDWIREDHTGGDWFNPRAFQELFVV